MATRFLFIPNSAMRSSLFVLPTLLITAGCSHPAPSGISSLAIEDTHLAIAANSSAAHVMTVEPSLEGSHPVEFFVQAALERNPEIQAMNRRVAALAEVAPQVTALPDPMLSSIVWPIRDNSPQTASGRMPSTLTLSQQFPWCGKLALRGDIADLETQIALTQLAETQLRVIEAVRSAYYELAFNQAAQDITVAHEKLLRDYLTFAEALYKVNKVSQQDVLRAQVERSKTQDLLIQLRRGLQEAQADLARLLSASPESDLRAARPGVHVHAAPEQIDRLYQAAITSRPDLQGRLQAIVRDQKLVELRKLQYYPDVMAGLSWSAITIDDALSPVANGHDNIGLNFSINLPIWHDKLRAGVLEAENRVAESARRYDAARDDTFRWIKRYVVQAHALDRQVALFRDEIVPRAEQTLRVASADYRVGRVDMLTLIDNWTQLLRFQIQQQRLEASLGQTLASLERVVGNQVAAPSEAEVLPQPQRVEK